MKLSKKTAGLAFAASLMASSAHAALEVSISDEYICPYLVSRTEVWDTTYDFEFMFDWYVTGLGASYGAQSDIGCCVPIFQRSIAVPSGASTVVAAHNLAPFSSDPTLNDELLSECVEYIGSGDIHMSPCETTMNYGNCTSLRASPKSSSTALALDAVNRPENVARTSEATKPLIVAADVLLDRKGALTWLGGMSGESKSPYIAITNSGRLLRNEGCKSVKATSSTDEHGRQAGEVYDCKQGLVVTQEIKSSNVGKFAAAKGATTFEIRPNVPAVSHYLATEDGKRQSSISWWEEGALYRVSLLHGDSDQSAWLKKVAAETTLVR